jgi:hypothetical protein
MEETNTEPPAPEVVAPEASPSLLETVSQTPEPLLVWSQNLKYLNPKNPEQQIVVTRLLSFDAYIAIGLSNGTVHLLNLETMSLCEVKAVLQCDLEAPVPKHAEFGIIGLLKIEESLIVVYESNIYSLQIPSLELQASQHWTIPIFSAGVNTFNSSTYISILDKQGQFSLLSYPTLERVWALDVALPLNMAIVESFSMSLDGHFIVVTNGLELC